MKKKVIIPIFIFFLFFGLGVLWYFRPMAEKQLLGILAGVSDEYQKQHPQYGTFYKDIDASLSTLQVDTKNPQPYLTLGLAWKSLADATHEKQFYQKAMEIYQAGIERTERKNIIFMMNAAKMAEYLEQYDTAEQWYKESQFVAPGEEGIYLARVELYEFKMKKSPEEILAVFDEGLSRVLGQFILLREKANYLIRVKRYEEALPIYEAISSARDEWKKLYAERIQELKEMIKQPQGNTSL